MTVILPLLTRFKILKSSSLFQRIQACLGADFSEEPFQVHSLDSSIRSLVTANKQLLQHCQ